MAGDEDAAMAAYRGIRRWPGCADGAHLARAHHRARPRRGRAGQRRIYILPTRAGLGFGALLLVLLIGSINYKPGPRLRPDLPGAACALVDMLATWRNLAHLRLRPGRASAVFAGEEAPFELLVEPHRRDRYALWIDVAGNDTAWTRAMRSTSRPAAAPPCPGGAERRARLAEGAARALSTRFPLGLFRAWSYWQPDSRALVYPFPEQARRRCPSAASAARTAPAAPAATISPACAATSRATRCATWPGARSRASTPRSAASW
jgi:hypothetical protein